MAIQPPSVENSNDCGKWRSVSPCSPSWASSTGPVAPAWMRAARETGSTSSTRSSAPQVDRDRAVVARAATSGVTPPTTEVPAAEGDRRDALARAPLEHPLDVGLIARARDEVGRMVEVPAKAADDVRVGLAQGVRGARVVVVGADVRQRRRRAAMRGGAQLAPTPAPPGPRPRRARSRGAPPAPPADVAQLRGRRLLVLEAPAPVLAPTAAHAGESMLTVVSPHLPGACGDSLAFRCSVRSTRARHPRTGDPRPRTVGVGADHGALARAALRALAGADRGRGRGDQGAAGARLAQPRRGGRAPGRLPPGRGRDSRSSCSRCAGRCAWSTATPPRAWPRCA